MRERSTQGGSGLNRVAIGVLIGVTLLVHGRNVVNDFLNWDDATLLVDNPLLKPVSAEHLGRIWTEPVEGLYTPMAYTVWSAAAMVARVDSPDANGVTLNPMAFHLLNVLLHAASVVLVFDVLLRLPLALGEGWSEGQRTVSIKKPEKSARNAPHPNPLPEGEGTKRILPAAIGAAMFAVHPIQVEAVAWISGMNNVLAGMFSLACIAAYLRFIASGQKAWYAVTVTAMLLALFSKPTAVVTPLVIVAIDGLILRRPIQRVARWTWPLAVLAVPFVIVGRLAQPAGGTFAPPLLQRLIVAGDAIGFYLCKLIWPWPLLIDYGRRPAVVGSGAPSIPHFAALVVAIVIAVVFWKRLRMFAGSLAVFVAGMVLVIGLVPFDFQAFSTVADRYAYLSMLGVAIAVMAAMSGARHRLVYVFPAAVVLALGAVSIRQIGLWSDDETLAGYTLSHNPTSLAAHMILAHDAKKRGEIAKSEALYRDGLLTFPNDSGLNREFGDLLFRTGRMEEAIPYFQKAFLQIRFDPQLLNNLGSALLNTDHVPEAIDAFKLLTERAPNHLNAHINLGHAYLILKQFDQAEPPLRRALQIDPNSAAAKRWMDVLIDGRSRATPR